MHDNSNAKAGSSIEAMASRFCCDGNFFIEHFEFHECVYCDSGKSNGGEAEEFVSSAIFPLLSGNQIGSEDSDGKRGNRDCAVVAGDLEEEALSNESRQLSGSGHGERVVDGEEHRHEENEFGGDDKQLDDRFDEDSAEGSTIPPQTQVGDRTLVLRELPPPSKSRFKFFPLI